jgi:hypothetical protein
LLLSLLTTAMTPVLALVFRDDGGWFRNDTEIGVGGGVEPPPPLHAAKAMDKNEAKSKAA